MSKRCSVCNHPQRHEIDVALVEGASNRHVMARFGVGRMAVQGNAPHARGSNT